MKTSHRSTEDAFVTRKDLRSIMEDARILMEDSCLSFEDYVVVKKDDNWAFNKKNTKDSFKTKAVTK